MRPLLTQESSETPEQRTTTTAPRVPPSRRTSPTRTGAALVALYGGG